MKYIIYAQTGNKEDWVWDEVDSTTDLNEAIAALRNGARVYERSDKFNVEQYTPGWGTEILVAGFTSKEKAQNYLDGRSGFDLYLQKPCTYRITQPETPLIIPELEKDYETFPDDDLPF